MFRTAPLSIIRSFSLYTQQWYMSYRFADSLRAGSGRFREKLMMMDRNCPKHVEFYSKNKFEKFIFGIKLYMFRTVPLSIIRNFSLYTQQWCVIQLASRIRTFRPDPARKLSANLYDIHHCCVYSEKLLMMDRGTVRNM